MKNRSLFAILLTVLMIPSVKASESTCDSENVKVQILGSGGPELDDGRSSSSSVIWVDGKARVLIDAGTGSSVLFGESGAQFADLQAILLTHLHVDHSNDLPAFVKGSFFVDRNEDLMVFGPQGNDLMPEMQSYFESLFGDKGAYHYLQSYWSNEQDSSYKIKAVNRAWDSDQIETTALNDHISVSSIGVHHGPISAVAWRVDISGCRITFSGDMSHNYKRLPKLAMDSDLLVVTYAIPEGAPEMAKNLHMVPSEIGEIAAEAKVKRLLLTHFMKRSEANLEASLSIIKKAYKGEVLLAEDLMSVPLYCEQEKDND